MEENIKILNSDIEVSNYQDLLKLIGVSAFLIDHLGLFVFHEEIILRIIGRMAMPIFTFYAGYNFRNKVRFNLLICSVLITLSYLFFLGLFPALDLLVGIILGNIYLSLFGHKILQSKNVFFIHFVITLLLGIPTHQLVEYGSFTIAFMQIGYLYANNQKNISVGIVLGVFLLIFYQYTWHIYSPYEVLGFLISIFGTLCLLYYIPHEKPINYDIKFISRDSLYIYTVSTCMYIAIANALSKT